MTAAVGPYRDFADAAADVVDSDASSVQVFDEELGGLRLTAWRGFHPVSAAFWGLVVPESASTCGMALVTGDRVVVPDLETEPALAGSEDLHEYRRSRLRAVQSTPLVGDDGRVVGMISTHWCRPHEPSRAELRRIDAVARRCAAAVMADRESTALELPAVAQLLHEVNRRIREMAAQFASTAADDAPQEYLCECGCGAWVALTGAEFDAGAAAHRPVTAHGHLLVRGRAARELSRSLLEDAAALRAEALQKRRKTDEIVSGGQSPLPE